MKLTLSLKNEYPVYPDIQDNLSLPESQRFTVILRKKSKFLHNYLWTKQLDNGNVITDPMLFVQEHLVRFVNPPEIMDADDRTVITLTPEILLSGVYPDLNHLITELMVSAGELDDEVNIDGKKP